MKASELVLELQRFIELRGDRNIVIELEGGGEIYVSDKELTLSWCASSGNILIHEDEEVVE